MNKIKRALVSVSDRAGLVPFVRGLRKLGVEILSTGGTCRFLKSQGIPVTEVSQVTRFPEILGGRVKTLHPKIHGGILADRGERQHLAEAKRLGLPLIDLVVVNLYPFEAAAGKAGTPLKDLIEQIDIGGVTLLRSAAKNFRWVGVVCRPDQYVEVLEELRRGRGRLSGPTRRRLAVEAYAESSYYDAVIHQTLAHRAPAPENGARINPGTISRWPQRIVLAARQRQLLRYGENPHQTGVWYHWPSLDGEEEGLGGAVQLHGKELSYNNLLDLDAALEIVRAFRRPCAAVIKHSNPCGVACADALKAAFQRAYACDPLSAFGGIVGLNRPLDRATAGAIHASGFLECIVAPAYRPEALQLLKTRKNLRIVQAPFPAGGVARRCLEFKQVGGGLLAQSPDDSLAGPARWRLAAGRAPSAAQRRDLLFAWTVAKFARSNSIVIAKEERTLGIGAGLTSRVDSVRFALKKAGPHARGAVLASDGFFPKPDGPAAAVRAGIRAIVQPGGSVQDQAVVQVARRAGIPMLLTRERHFRH